MEYNFTATIKNILSELYVGAGVEIYERSILLQYINEKTKSATKGSKSRGSFANLYAIYVLVEDYLAGGFSGKDTYKDYAGAQYSNLLKRQRELPFGSKLQNHALNNRVNTEFEKFFPTFGIVPIMRNLETNRYWINENLLLVSCGNSTYNIAKAVIAVIDRYIAAKQTAFNEFISRCEELQTMKGKDEASIREFIEGLLAPNIDARLFEIVSFSILKYHYKEQSIVWGFSKEELTEENLKLYKTGRTNANDGGIDFVMRPLGRFFQVTESLDFKKYFLDIDKIERYPICFVVKSNKYVDKLKEELRQYALKTYVIKEVVDKYMACIEEIINIPILLNRFRELASAGKVPELLDEIILQSKVEFNYEEE